MCQNTSQNNKPKSTKEKILSILEENKGLTVSGEKLAQICGVSRAAIWKAINALREQDCQIEGTTNGGYILKNQTDIFSQQSFIEFLEKSYPEYKNSHIECFRTIDSTNTYAKRLLSECGNLRNANGLVTPAGEKFHKAMIIAESQTNGRGRLGRTFYSPEKSGIYLSIIYAPQGGITEPAKLTAFSAVAICRVLKRLYKVNPQIKWINDIYINGKKIAGILTEGFTNFETQQIESAIIGIGINICDNPDVFPPEVQEVAGSITGTDSLANHVQRTQLSAEICGEVLKIFEEPQEKCLAEYKAASFLIGTTVTVHPVIGDDTSIYEAKAVDIAEDAGLVVELADGSRKVLNSGEVSLHSVARVL